MTYGFTQKELADNSGVSLRSIQMYEQRHKNINKASAETLYRLSKILGCTIEDLMENDTYYAVFLKILDCKPCLYYMIRTEIIKRDYSETKRSLGYRYH